MTEYDPIYERMLIRAIGIITQQRYNENHLRIIRCMRRDFVDLHHETKCNIVVLKKGK